VAVAVGAPAAGSVYIAYKALGATLYRRIKVSLGIHHYDDLAL